MKKSTLFILIMAGFLSQIPGERRIRISDLGRPVALDMDQSRLYILENAAVSIYSLGDFRLINKFGKKGQGPGEFVTMPHVHITLDCSTDRLIVGSIRKVSIWSKDGRFIRETRAVNQAYRLVAMDTSPGKERYLGWSRSQQEGINYNTIVIFDGRLNCLQEVYRDRDPFQGPGKGYDMLPRTFSFLSHRGRILLPGRDNASIDGFDLDMNSKFTIRVAAEPLRVGSEFKHNMIRFLKTSPETKNVFSMLQPIRFPRFFPAIHSFYADLDTVYVMTWKRKEGKTEFFTFDLEGRFRKRLMLPIRHETAIQPYPTVIRNRKLVQLVEGEEEQDWELRVTEIR